MDANDPSRRLLITVAVMAATVMQVLDITIVNVALPHMSGQLGATPDQISWVLTSYLVSSGIVMPLTGYFTDRLGQRRFLFITIIGFVAASVMCGLAANLSQIVLFRTLQGVFGAALVPLSQAIMVQSYPQNERGKAMAIWGIGVMVGPILGPTLGGYLTEYLSWRWTFFINLPVGLLSLFIAWRVIPDTERRQRTMDWSGLVMLAFAIGGLQLVLDRGNEDDWFNSHLIQAAAVASVVGLLAFIYHGFARGSETVFDPRIFRDRNFTASGLLIAGFGLGLFGMLILQPILMQSLLDIPTFTAGLLMAPRGVASMVSMYVVGKLINKVDPRAIVMTGVALSTIGTWGTTHYNLDIDAFWLVWPVIVQGLGLGMIFVPISTVAFATLDKRYAAEAAGLFSLLRTIGSSIGISIVATVLTRHTQIAWNQIGQHIQPFNPALVPYLERLQLAPTDPQAAAVLAHELGRQAEMAALLDSFTLIMWSFLAMAPLVLLLGKSKTETPDSVTTGSH
ncbi:MAG TPA: DHA2 family efflux MFS transporter permease subunit [Steroidobacteraceae bacterium]|nr:DHA2 family efflux MFS transporter permease subunit [Steroidobacteraceae bacterium]